MPTTTHWQPVAVRARAGGGDRERRGKRAKTTRAKIKHCSNDSREEKQANDGNAESNKKDARRNCPVSERMPLRKSGGAKRATTTTAAATTKAVEAGGGSAP